ncbi:DivIVA domain-containing protein [Nocardioides hwasunensis]|uniref:DivIVA domain-containing protein n=1 Tax=Nocardioides hwasunensis TaxID=397258 RepID=A0ABR8MLG1_9ACTN|nr:DivIVA domain-containing protein [Nocardioides hwasunensis]MBD3915359.1 DivIVA domain-containing protein [Nocardioides hwasunensis]
MTLERPRFTTTKLREGYDTGEVDSLVDLVFLVLAHGEANLSPSSVENYRFTPTRLRDGYDMGEVDQWLDEAVVALADHRRKPGAGPSAAGATAYATPPATPAGSPTRSDAIVEVGGGTNRTVLLVVALVVLAVAAYVLFR